MNTKNKHSLNAFGSKQRAKDRHFNAQMKRVFKAFSDKPKTMLQVSIETGIMRANICRYVAKWRKSNKIGVSHYGICPVSKWRKVGFYTTDPNLFIRPKRK